jgi:hypothetical protein
LKECLKCLHAQTYQLDAIYLGLPAKARRLDKEYPPLPSDIADLCTVVPMLTDFGPASKIYGALVSESKPDTLILSCDDDTVHEPHLVETLVKHAEDYPQSTVCGTGALIGRGLKMISIVSSLNGFRGWNGLTGFPVGREGRNVDLIFGVGGVMYRRGFFHAESELYTQLFKYALDDERVYMNDDVLISGYLSKYGVKRRLFCDVPTVKCVDSGAGDALSVDIIHMFTRMQEAIDQVKVYGMFSQMEPLDTEETVTWRVLLAIIVGLLIILLIYIWFRLL